MSEHNLLTKEGYFNRFMELCENARNYKDAYELLEQELFEKYQICKYSSYESFRDAKSKYFNIPKIIK